MTLGTPLAFTYSLYTLRLTEPTALASLAIRGLRADCLIAFACSAGLSSDARLVIAEFRRLRVLFSWLSAITAVSSESGSLAGLPGRGVERPNSCTRREISVSAAMPALGFAGADAKSAYLQYEACAAGLLLSRMDPARSIINSSHSLT